MKNKRWVLAAIGLLVLVLLVDWYLRQRGEGQIAIDLIDRFDTAEKRSTDTQEKVFRLVELTVNGETRRGIFAHPTSRMIWKLTVPPNAWLRMWLALDPEAWTKEGDGVLFRIGVSDGRTYEELLAQHVNPFGTEGDRRWLPVGIDLSPYARQEIELILNTNSSLPGKGDDSRNDWAVWGEPHIFVR